MKNKQFIVGPVELYQETRDVYQTDFTYFRTPEFGAMVKTTLAQLSKMIGNKKPNSMIYLTASGTAGMEAVIENCTNKDDKCLVINGGTFGHRFCELLEYHNIDFSSIDLEWNETLTQKHLNPYANKGYTMLFVNLHETSTGQLYDIEMISKFAKENNLLLVVDAISTFLADEFDMNKYGIDATIISSQKGLCLSAGLSFISFSERMLKRVYAKENVSSKYFDFKDYLKNIERGQTPYTPAVFIMYELQDMLGLIEKEGGLNKRLKFIEEKCKYFRKKALEIGLKIPDYPLSNMLTPVLFENISAYDVIQVLKDKYCIFVNPCGGKLADVLLRVSHIGNTTIADIDDLIEKMQLAINEVKERTICNVK